MLPGAQLHGTCLGFEALALIASGNMSILSAFDSDDNASPLLLTEDGLRGSSLFGSFPARLLGAVQDKALAMENHSWGARLPCVSILAMSGTCLRGRQEQSGGTPSACASCFLGSPGTCPCGNTTMFLDMP